ncbi:MAG: helix-turn-helix domain-containing protein [bacterium]|nr:helix-turn-helix domain-containing protein [bacterium]
MEHDDFTAAVIGVSALAEPVRRDLYLYIATQADAVSRDQASQGVGVARHTAKFHLDRLVADGLLETEFRQLSRRRGPGSGRPTKLYRRSAGEVSVSLPQRHYDLAGHLMAQAIEDTSVGLLVIDALHQAAEREGARIGEEIRAELGARPGRTAVRAGVCTALAGRGYEPRTHGREIALINCPFHALAQEHTALVCGMNFALLGALVERADRGRITARLDPAETRCCVVLELAGSTA